MDIAQFRASLASLGADLERWPADEAEAAVALLATSDEAVTLFAQATSDDLAVLGDDAGGLDALVDKTLGRVERGG
jgi:altronate dehydratase